MSESGGAFGVPAEDKIVHYDPEREAWFFWDETWTSRLGPFESKQEAHRALEQYAKDLG